jgi:hypothetical protein
MRCPCGREPIKPSSISAWTVNATVAKRSNPRSRTRQASKWSAKLSSMHGSGIYSIRATNDPPMWGKREPRGRAAAPSCRISDFWRMRLSVVLTTAAGHCECLHYCSTSHPRHPSRPTTHNPVGCGESAKSLVPRMSQVAAYESIGVSLDRTRPRYKAQCKAGALTAAQRQRTTS